MIGVQDAALVAGEMPGTNVPVWLIHAPSLYLRGDGLYMDAEGRDWPDNVLRFAFLARIGAAIAQGALGSWLRDIVHANDWHGGLLPLLLSGRGGHRPKSVFTIHNMAFQGSFPAETISALGVPDSYFHDGGIEFYG